MLFMWNIIGLVFRWMKILCKEKTKPDESKNATVTSYHVNNHIKYLLLNENSRKCEYTFVICMSFERDMERRICVVEWHLLGMRRTRQKIWLFLGITFNIFQTTGRRTWIWCLHSTVKEGALLNWHIYVKGKFLY